MAVNERRNATNKADAEEPVSRDTWPVPPPQSTVIATTGGGGAHDTIPTPPPDASDDLADIEIPTLRGLDVQAALGTEGEAPDADEKMQQGVGEARSGEVE